MRFNTGVQLLKDTIVSKGLRDSFNLCLNYFTMQWEPEMVWTQPIYLQVEPTTRCNFKCKMCRGVYEARICDDLNLVGFQRIINQIPQAIKVHLQGIGEPFLNKDIFKMIRYAKEKKVKVDLTTNASLIDAAIAREIVSSGLDYIEFPLDSTKPEIYEEIRCGATFENVVNNLKTLIAAKGSAKKPEMKIVTVLMNDNVQEPPLMVEFAHRLGIPSVFLIHVQPWDKDYRKGHYSGDASFKEKLRLSLSKAQEIATELNIFLDMSGVALEDNLPRACKRPWLSLSILADGYVTPCCRIINPDETKFGNIFKDDFEEIWNSPAYRAFRRMLKGNAVPVACRNCYYYSRHPMSRDHI